MNIQKTPRVSARGLAVFEKLPYKPKYLPGPPLLGDKPEPGALYGARVDGWCMFPNLWHNDCLLVRGVFNQRLQKGRDFNGAGALQGCELLQWRALHRKILHVTLDGKQMVKRLQVNVACRTPQVLLTCDNVRMFHPIHIDGEELVILGVVEMVIADGRDKQAVPAAIADEYDRVFESA